MSATVDIATLGLEVRSDGVVVASRRLRDLESQSGRSESANNSLSSSFGALTRYIQAAAASFTLFKLAEYAKDCATLAARVETLNVVMKVVGANAGYTSSQMDAFTAGLKKMGITTQESMSNLIKMAGANMDLAKASKLARVAQDAAVIGGINSSEAFGRIIQGIRSGEVEIFKTIGINVNLQQSYEKLATQLDKNAKNLTEVEKVTARVNAVEAFGANIAGAYEASMSTAGKQMLSMSRYAEELKLQIGQAFSPALNAAIETLVSSLKFLDKNFDSISDAAKGVVAVGLLVYFARLTETVTTAIVAENDYMRQVSAGNVVTLGSAEALAQRAAAQVVSTSNVVATTAAQEAYWRSELASAVALKERLVVEAQAIPIGVSRASNSERIAIANMEVRATEIMLAEAISANTVAQAANITATTALTVAQGNASVAGRVLIGVQGGLKAALSLVGGGLGLIVIAVMAAYYAWDKYTHAQEDAQRKINQFDNSSLVGQLVQENKELEKQYKLLTQTKAQKAAESESQFQVAMKNRYTDERVLVEKLATAKANANVYGIQQNTSEMKAIESKLFLVRRDIEYAARLRKENEQIAAKTEATRAIKNTSPVVAAKGGTTTTTETDFAQTKAIGDAIRAWKESFWAWEDAGQKVASKSQVDTLTWQHEQGLLSTQSYIDQKEALEKGVIQREIDRNNNRIKEMKSSLAITMGPGKTLDDEQYRKHAEAQTQLNNAITKGVELTAQLSSVEQAAAIAREKDDISKQRISDEIALQTLQAKGYAEAATAAQNELKYSDLRKKDYTEEQIAQIRINDGIAAANALYNKQLSIERELNSLKEANATFTASQVGTNSSGEVTDAVANAMAIENNAYEIKLSHITELQDANQRAFELNQKTEADAAATSLALDQQVTNERIRNAKALAKITGDQSKAAWDATMSYAKKAVPQLAMFDKLIAASQKDFAIKGKDGVIDQTKSNLAMYSAFAGAATDIFSGLAEQQDQTSREGFEAAKNYSLAAAVMNTAAGIMNAFATSSNIYAGVAMAAVVAAAGVIQIAKIQSTTFGGGGSVSAPSGTAAGAGANGGGVAGTLIGERYKTVEDSMTTEALQNLADSADNASMAIGKIADGFSKISDMFAEGGYGAMFAGSAYGISGNAYGGGFGGSNMPKIFQDSTARTLAFGIGDILASFIGGGGMGPMAKINDALAGALFGVGNVFKYKASAMMFGGTSSNVAAMDVDEYRRKGGLFGGGATKYDIKYDAEWSKFLQKMIDTIGTSVQRMAITMGTTATVAGVKLPGVVIATTGRTQEQIAADVQKWLEKVAASLAKTVPELEKYAFAGENYYLALTRLNDALVSTNQGLEKIGMTLIVSTLEGANAAYKLQDAMGGAEAFSQKVDDYFTGMFTEAEQKAMATALATSQVTNGFNELNKYLETMEMSSVAIPKTREEFIALVQSIDVTTEAGAAMFAALMNLSGAFVTMTDEATKAKEKLSATIIETAMSAATALKDILGGSLSTLTPKQLMAQQQAAWQGAIATGNTTALPGLAKSYLEAARAMYGSGTGYQDIYANVTSTLAGIAGIEGGITLDSVERQIASIQAVQDAIADGTQAMVASIQDLKDAILGLKKAGDENTDKIVRVSIGTADAIIGVVDTRTRN